MHDWTLNGVKATGQPSPLRSIAVLEHGYFRVPLSSSVEPSRRLLQRREVPDDVRFTPESGH